VRSEGGNILAELGSMFRAAAEPFAGLFGVNRIYVEQASARFSRKAWRKNPPSFPGGQRVEARAERRHRALTH
jgi:hypothetical protein